MPGPGKAPGSLLGQLAEMVSGFLEIPVEPVVCRQLLERPPRVTAPGILSEEVRQSGLGLRICRFTGGEKEPQMLLPAGNKSTPFEKRLRLFSGLYVLLLLEKPENSGEGRRTRDTSGLDLRGGNSCAQERRKKKTKEENETGSR